MSEEVNFYNVLILYNENFYKEIDLDGFESDRVVIGNNSECNIRLNIEEDDVTVEFIKKNNWWQICDGNNAYCVINGVKVHRRTIVNGDKVDVKSIHSKKELFKINYFIDFIVEKENYDKIVSLDKLKKLKIGSDESNNIIIKDKMIEKHHAEINKDKDIYYLSDLKSKFGIYLNGKKVEGNVCLKENDFVSICGYKFLFRKNTLSMSKLNEKIELNKIEEIDNPLSYSLLEYPCFYRSPRLLKDVPREEIVIDSPPEKAKMPNNNIIITLIPLVGTIIITMLMSSNQGKSGVYSVIMVVLAGVTTLLAYVMQVVNTKKQQFKRYKTYKEYVKDRESLIINKRELMINSIKEMNPESEECIRFLEEFNRRIWERTPDHEDFLNVSIGKGEGELTFNIKVPDKSVEIDKDKLKDDPRKLKDVYGKIEDIPIFLNLLKDYPVGIYGNRPYTIEFIKNILIKISTLHYYEDVKIAVIHPKEEEEQWNWVKWLPHVWTDKKEIRYVADTKESAHNVLNTLYDEIKGRKLNEESSEKTKYKAYYVVIVADNSLVENEPIMPILESGEGFGAIGIFLYDHIGLVPKDCKKLIEVTDNKNTKLINIENVNDTKELVFDCISNTKCMEFSRRMSPIFVKSSFTQNSLTSYLTLFDLYKVKSENDLEIINYWNSSEVYKTMSVPLGLKAGDEMVYLNLHEKFHGPHGLVAGTTGSGKSEILQTYIASLAINYHPYDIGIIIIDYKGGGMANQFRDLPHLVGTITNLDGNQINRALISIKSELKRRQKIFAESNVNHIDSYIKLFKKGVVNKPLPHLIIIADEFAELKNDQPDFMAELVSAARIGRSLGVHLILATQKPSGVVDDQIWSNSKFKLCLKVQDTEDSREMIKSPLAANIVEPGRAYFQVGNNEIFELFQSAWSGAKKYDDDDVNKKEIEIAEMLVDGTRKVIYSSKEATSNKEGKTQLDTIIDKIRNVAIENGIERLQGPWLPPLEKIIYLDEIIGAFNLEKWGETKNHINPFIGILDNPEKQIQYNLGINLSEDGHMMIIGSPGVGKTTLIQTLIMSLIRDYTPDMVNIYILDFGTRILKMYEEAPQVGGVITADEEESMKNFMKFIHRQMKKRKDILSQEGVSNTLAYKEATGETLPQIIIIIDNFSAFMELYEDYDEDITKFSRDGANLGISIIITASSTSNVRYKISSNFKVNLTLNCVDKGEYSNVFGRVSLEPSSNQGRGLVKDEQICEFQTALPIRGETEGERASNIKAMINSMKNHWKGKEAPSIPSVPEILYIDDFLKHNTNENSREEVLIGLDVNEFEYISFNIESTNFIPVIGKKRSGRSNCLKAMIYSMDRNFDKEKHEIYVFNSSSYGLVGMEDLSIVRCYEEDSSVIIDTLLDLKQEIDYRKDIIEEAVITNKGRVKESEIIKRFIKKIIVIDDIGEFFNYIDSEYEIIDLLSEIIDNSNGYGITIIGAGDEDKFVDLSYSHSFMTNIKNNNKGLLLSGLDYQNYFDVMVNYGSNERPVKPGDGYVINDGEYTRIKIPLVQE